MSIRYDSAIALVLAVAASHSAIAQGQEASRIRPSGPPRINFNQVRVAKWRANAEKPTIMLVSQTASTQVRTRTVAVRTFVPEQRVRVVERDGKKVKQTFTVNVPVTKQVEEKYVVQVPGSEPQISDKSVDKVQVWDIDGKKLDPNEFEELFKKSRHVFLLSQTWEKNPPVDAFYRSVLNRDVLFLYVDEPVRGNVPPRGGVRAVPRLR